MNIKLNNINYYYQEEGINNQNVLIMLHGNNEDFSIFSEAIEELKERYHIYALDSRNHGRTDRTQEVHYIDIAFDIAIFIRKLNLQNISILGFSDGAIIALFLASKLYFAIDRLYLCGLNLFPSGIKYKVFRSIKKEYKHTNDRNVQMMLNEPYFSKGDFGDLKAKISLIYGENDCMKKQHIALASKWLKTEAIIVPGEDHASYIIHNTKILDYID